MEIILVQIQLIHFSIAFICLLKQTHIKDKAEWPEKPIFSISRGRRWWWGEMKMGSHLERSAWNNPFCFFLPVDGITLVGGAKIHYSLPWRWWLLRLLSSLSSEYMMIIIIILFLSSIGNSHFLSKLLSSPQSKPWGVKKLAWPNDFGAGGSKGPLLVRVQLPLQLLLLRKGSKGVWASTNATETRLKGLLQNLPPTQTSCVIGWINTKSLSSSGSSQRSTKSWTLVF